MCEICLRKYINKIVKKDENMCNFEISWEILKKVKTNHKYTGKM